MTFEDYNGDGMNDIRVTVEDEAGVELWMTWIYDNGDYVYLKALEYPPVEIRIKPYVTASFSGGKVRLKWDAVDGAKNTLYTMYRMAS